MTDDEVTFSIDKETLLNILRHAASKDRTIVEFTREDGELKYAKEITEHVEALEDQVGD